MDYDWIENERRTTQFYPDMELAGEGRPLTYAEWEAKYAALLAQKKRAIEAREKKKREKKAEKEGVPPLETPMRT
jgi:hypothetical protein